MDELQLLEATLTKPAPSADVIDRRRHQLQDTMRGPVRARRSRLSRRPMIMIGVTAATAAASVAIVATDAAPPSPSKDGEIAVQMSGSQVLLVAATAAESKPATTGTYWHVKSVGPEHRIYESWTKTDGQRWYRLQGEPVTKLPGRHPIRVRRTDLGVAQIAKLPTSAAALKVKLLKSATVPAKNSKDPMVKETFTIMLLGDLLSRVPAPPKVRAAAFRALAELPHIKNQGRVSGGQSLLFSGQGGGTKLVVDPKTTAVSAEGFADINGKQESMGGSTITAGWTDRLPR